MPAPRRSGKPAQKSIAILFFTRPTADPSIVYVLLGLPWQFRLDGAASHATWELPIVTQRDALVLARPRSSASTPASAPSHTSVPPPPPPQRPRDLAVRLAQEYTLNNLGGRRMYDNILAGTLTLSSLGVRVYAFELKPSQAVSLEGLGRSLQRLRRNALHRSTPSHPYEDWRWYDINMLTDITPQTLATVPAVAHRVSSTTDAPASKSLRTSAAATSPSKTARNVASQSWLILRHVALHARFRSIFLSTPPPPPPLQHAEKRASSSHAADDAAPRKRQRRPRQQSSQST